MSDSFDPYHDWLGIAPKDQPPHHYRLLGIDLYEDKAKVIDSAVDRQMAHLRTFQTGPRAKYCQELLNKVSAARVTLLDPQKKAAYDAQLRKTLVAQPVSVPLQVAQPLLVDGSPLLVEDSTVPVAAVAPDSLSAPTAQSAKRPQRKTGPPWIALGVGVLLLGIAAAVGLIMMTGGDDPRVAEVPAEQTPPPKKVPAKPTKKTPDETVAPKVNVDTPKEPKPPADPPAGTTPPQIDPPINKAKEPVVVADVDEPSEFEFPHTDDAPKKDPPPVAAKKSKKAAIPTDEALKKAKSEIRNVFDFKSATNLAARAKLTKNILATALESENDRAARFAMLTMARDMAVFLGDYATAERVIGEMDKRFDVDVIAMRSKAVIRAITAKVPTDKRAAAAHAALQLARELHDADRYDEAKTIVTVVQRASGRLRDRELTLEAKQLATEVREAANHYEPAREAFATLKTTPDDPAANTVAGKYLCFVKGEWERGLKMLAKGDDAELKDLANGELKGVSNAKAQVALGEGWSNIATKKEHQAHYELLLRAAGWYRDALPSLKGLEKTRVQKRLEAIRERLVKAAGRKTKLENLAIGATADESSANAGENAQQATDGKHRTGIGQYWYANRPAPGWIRVKFAKSREIHAVRLLMPANGHGPRNYTVLAERKGKEVPIANVFNNQGPGVSVAPSAKAAGYIYVTIKLSRPVHTTSLRLLVTKTSADRFGPIVNEMEVIGIKTETWPELISRLKKR